MSRGQGSHTHFPILFSIPASSYNLSSPYPSKASSISKKLCPFSWKRLLLPSFNQEYHTSPTTYIHTTHNFEITTHGLKINHSFKKMSDNVKSLLFGALTTFSLLKIEHPLLLSSSQSRHISFTFSISLFCLSILIRMEKWGSTK